MICGWLMTNAAPETLSDPDRSGLDRARFAAVVVVGHTLKHLLTSGVSSVLMPEIKRDLALTGTQVGALGSMQQFSGLFGTISAGYLGDRFTAKTGLMLAVSLAVTCASLLLLGVASSFVMLMVAMACLGFGPSTFHPPAVGALSRRFPDRRAFAISLHGMGGSLGEVLGPLVAAGLLAVLFWRNVLAVEAIPALFTALFLLSLLRDGGRGSEGTKGSFRVYLASFSALLSHRALFLILLVTACRSVGQSTTSVFLPIYLREDLAFSPSLIGGYIAMSQLAGVGSQPVMGMLSDRFGHKAVILPALLTFSLLLALIPLAGGKVELALVILALGVFVFSMQSILTSAAVELAGPEVHSTIVSLIYASTFIGSLAPVLAGVLADRYGLQSTFYLSASLALVAAGIMAAIRLPGGTREARTVARP